MDPDANHVTGPEADSSSSLGRVAPDPVRPVNPATADAAS